MTTKQATRTARYRSSQWFIWRTEEGEYIDPANIVGYGDTVAQMEADASRKFVAWIKQLPEGATYEELWDGENYCEQDMECDADEFGLQS